MRMYGFLSIFLAIILSIHGQRPQQVFPPPMRNMLASGFNPPLQSPAIPRIPFPQCLSTQTAANILNTRTLANIFQIKLQEEDNKLKSERLRNDNLNNNDIAEFPALQLRSDKHNGALIARTATKVSEEVLNQLGCDTNATVTAQIDQFLQSIPVPPEFCVFRSNINCDSFIQYRTLSGVCNNLQRPYDGASQTAFARLIPAAYDDGISKPRSQSVLGGPLPACRQISLSMGSKPMFDTTYNNLFVSYGQFIVHDVTFAVPVSDSGRTPITSCSCDSQEPDKCLVVKVPADDPYMSRQRCMATPATAQGFTNQICALGVKDQLNGDSHYLDLSTIYGSTLLEGRGLRTGAHGLLKSMKQSWSKFDLPPGQAESKTCSDGTSSNRCFAGGDSRLMENIILSGLQAQWVRLHNVFSRDLEKIRPDWRTNDNILYEEAKKVLSALHQRYIYEDWIPILIGPDATRKFLSDNDVFSRYDPSARGVVYNEVGTAAFRLHTLARDLYSRCRPNGEFIDQIWLTDVAAKCKLAYDAQNNGLDSFLCGSLYDYGFAGDTNYAQHLHHRLFESTNSKGEVTRNDLIAINICRGREHGLPGYNAYRQLCGLRQANQFADFADTMTSDAVQKLQSIYQHPDDVDLFVGVNHENHVPGGLVGPVQACLIGFQFYNLKFGDRFFYKHEGQFTREQLNSIEKYTYNCFICHSTDIEKVPLNAFRPPNNQTNPLGACSQCPVFDFNPWR